MSVNIQDTYSVKFEAQNATKSAHDFANAMGKLSQAIDKFDANKIGQLNKNLTGLNALGSSTALNTLSSIVTNLTTSLNAMTSSLAAATNSLNQTAKAHQAVAPAANKAANAVNNVTNAAKQNAKQMKQTAQTSKSAAEEYIVSWSSVFRFFQANLMTRAVWSFIGAIQSGTTEAVKLAQAVGEVQTISLNLARTAPVRNLTSILADVRNISDAFNLKQADVIAAQYEAVSNQIKGAAESMMFVAEAAKFARIAQTDVSHSVDLLSSAINSFGYETDRAGELAAKFFKAIEVGRFRAEDISSDFGRSAVLARQLGIEMEELLSAFATTTIQGIKFANTQTFINNIMLKLIKPTDKMKDTLKDMGVESGQAAIKTFGFIGTIRELNKVANASLDPFGELGEMFGTIRAITGATTFIDPRVEQQYLKTLDVLQSANVDYVRAFEIIMGNPGEIFQREMNKIKNIVISDFGAKILDFLLQWNNETSSLSKKFTWLLTLGIGLGTFVIGFKLAAAATAFFTQAVAYSTTALNANTAAQAVNNAATVATTASAGKLATIFKGAFTTGTLLSRIKVLGSVIAGVGFAISSVMLLFGGYKTAAAFAETQTYKTASGFAALAEEARKYAEFATSIQTDFFGKLAFESNFVIDLLSQGRNIAAAERRKVLNDEGNAIANTITNMELNFRRFYEMNEAGLGVQDRLLKRFKFGVEGVNVGIKAWGKDFRRSARDVISDVEKLEAMQGKNNMFFPINYGGALSQIDSGLGVGIQKTSNILNDFAQNQIPQVVEKLDSLQRTGFDREWIGTQRQLINEGLSEYKRLQNGFIELRLAFNRGLISPSDLVEAQESIENAFEETNSKLVHLNEDASMKIRDQVQATKQYGDEIKRVFDAMDQLIRDSEGDISSSKVQRKIDKDIKLTLSRVANIQDITGIDPRQIFAATLREDMSDLKADLNDQYSLMQKISEEYWKQSDLVNKLANTGKDYSREESARSAKLKEGNEAYSKLTRMQQDIVNRQIEMGRYSRGEISSQEVIVSLAHNKVNILQRERVEREEAYRSQKAAEELQQKLAEAQRVVSTVNQERLEIVSDLERILAMDQYTENQKVTLADGSKKDVKAGEGGAFFGHTTDADRLRNDLTTAAATLKSPLADARQIAQAIYTYSINTKEMRATLLKEVDPAENIEAAVGLYRALASMGGSQGMLGGEIQQQMKMLYDFIQSRTAANVHTQSIDTLLANAEALRGIYKTQSTKPGDTGRTIGFGKLLEDSAGQDLTQYIEAFAIERQKEIEFFKKQKDLRPYDTALSSVFEKGATLRNRLPGYQNARENLMGMGPALAQYLQQLGIPNSGISDFIKGLQSGTPQQFEQSINQLNSSLANVPLDETLQTFSSKLGTTASSFNDLSLAVDSLYKAIDRGLPADLKPDGRANGGLIRGKRGRDVIPARLTAGEYVVKKSAVDRLGKGFFDSINQYQYGGAVRNWWDDPRYRQQVMTQRVTTNPIQYGIGPQSYNPIRNANAAAWGGMSANAGVWRGGNANAMAWRGGGGNAAAWRGKENFNARYPVMPYVSSGARSTAINLTDDPIARSNRRTKNLMWMTVADRRAINILDHPDLIAKRSLANFMRGGRRQVPVLSAKEKRSLLPPEAHMLLQQQLMGMMPKANDSILSSTRLTEPVKALDAVFGAQGPEKSSFWGKTLGSVGSVGGFIAGLKRGKGFKGKAFGAFSGLLWGGAAGKAGGSIADDYSSGNTDSAVWNAAEPLLALAAFELLTRGAGKGLRGLGGKLSGNKLGELARKSSRYVKGMLEKKSAIPHGGKPVKRGGITKVSRASGAIGEGIDPLKGFKAKQNLAYGRFLKYGRPGLMAYSAIYEPEELPALAAMMYHDTIGKALTQNPWMKKKPPLMRNAGKQLFRYGLPAYVALSALNSKKYAQKFSGKENVTGSEMRAGYLSNLNEFLSFGLFSGQGTYDFIKGSREKYGYDTMSSFRDWVDTMGLEATSDLFGVGKGVSAYQAQKAYEEAMRKRGKLRGFASGGKVPNVTNMPPMGSDRVLAALTPGEFIIRKQVVDSLGKGFFENLNTRGYADGGSVGNTAAPTLMAQGNGMNGGNVSISNDNNFNITAAGDDANAVAFAVINKLDTWSVRNQRQVKQNRPSNLQNRKRRY